MTFEEYAQEHLVKHGFNDVDLALVRAGWNAAKADGTDIGVGTMQAARAQGVEAVAGYVSKGSLQMVADGERCPLAAIYPEPTRHINVPIYTRSHKAQGVPEGWKVWETNGSIGNDMVVEHPDGKPRRFFNRRTEPLMFEFLRLLTKAPPADTPEGEWVKCSERLPTEADADANGEVWWVTPNDKGEMTVISMQWSFGSPSDQGVTLLDEVTHWKPTGLTRPAEPDMGGEK